MIYVIRHGQTDLNKEGRLQGRKGLPLNTFGIEQAESLKKDLKGISFDYIFSSPQERSVHTAEISTGKSPKIDPRLDVFNLGAADGLKKDEVQMKGAIPDPDVYDGVEDIPSYMKRVFSFMQDLENKYGTSDANIMISGHRCTTGCIGAYFEGIPEDRNILKLSSDNGGYKVYSFKRQVNI